MEQAILDEPENARNVFYLAQSYRDCNNYEKAIENYKKRVGMVGFAEEVFHSLYEIGLCKIRMNEPFENFVGDLLKAYSYRPSRIEPLHKIARYCRTKNMAYLGYQLCKHVLEKELKSDDILFVEKDIFAYKMKDEIALSAYWAGFYQEAKRLTMEILKEKRYPPEDEVRLKKNLDFCDIKLGESPMEKIFNHIYDCNEWGYPNQKFELSSGSGNTEEFTKDYRNFLRKFIEKNNIQSVVDIGCGIWEFEHEEFNNILYVGLDCVKRVIDFNIDKYITSENKKKRKFICADILKPKTQIVQTDLCIIKDTLQHLDNENVVKLLNKAMEKSKVIILINDHQQNEEIEDITIGQYRPLNYEKYPLKLFNPQLIGSFHSKHIIVITDLKIHFEEMKEQNQSKQEENKQYENKQEENNKEDNISDDHKNDKINHSKEIKDDIDSIIKNDNTNYLEETVEQNILVNVEKVKKNGDKILLTILARNKGHVLHKYLECIKTLDYNKKMITIYINTNNNTDNTLEILDEWIIKNKDFYNFIEIENIDREELMRVSDRPHDWNKERFRVLGEIRNRSLKKTVEYDCDYYFVVDCDNFINPNTLKILIKEDKPIIAPMLKSVPEENDSYSNFFCDIDVNGYYKNHENYEKILERSLIGTFKVPVVHCTYLIKREYIKYLTYVDSMDDYEFVIFSKSARNNGISQFICNKEDFGILVHFFEEKLSLDEEKIRLNNFFGIEQNEEKINEEQWNKIDHVEPNKIDVKKETVIVSLTTLPSRMYNIHKTIESIKNQTLKPDKIYLCISEFSKRENTKYQIPEHIKDDIEILNSTHDYGPITKLIPILNKIKDPNTIIITIDDDLIYDDNTIKQLVKESRKYPEYAIGYCGWIAENLKKNDNYGLIYPDACNEFNPKYTNILEGYRGVLYKRKFFDDDIMKYVDNKDGFFADDVVVGGYLAIKGIRKIIIKYKYDKTNVTPSFGELFAPNSLSIMPEFKERNKRTVKFMEGKNEGIWGTELTFGKKIVESISPEEIHNIEILMTNNEVITKKHKIGLIITTYKRSKYLEITLRYLRFSNLDNTILMIIDDYSNKKKVTQLIKSFNMLNVPIIKIFKKENNNMYHSLRVGWDILEKMGCDYFCNLDSDTIMHPLWLYKLKELYQQFESELSINKTKTLITGFNTTRNHKVIGEYGNYYKKSSIGGVNLFFHKDLYKEIKDFMKDRLWDFYIVNHMNHNEYQIICTKPSVIQHIGFKGLNSFVENNNFDFAKDFTIADKDFTFYPCLYYDEYNIEQIKEKSAQEMAEYCLHREDIVAFTSDGWMKSELIPIENMKVKDYISHRGLYVKV